MRTCVALESDLGISQRYRLPSKPATCVAYMPKAKKIYQKTAYLGGQHPGVGSLGVADELPSRRILAFHQKRFM